MKLHGNLPYVSSLEASIAFYSEALGLPVLDRPVPHLAIIGLDNGVLYLHEDPEDGPDWMKEALESRSRSVGLILHIEVDSVAELKDRLAAADVEVSQGPVEAHGQVQLYVYDPSGYNLVFIERIA